MDGHNARSGFGSHLEGEAQQVFADHKILVIKEEGDMSQVCRAYNKDVSLSDNQYHYSFFTGIQTHIKMVDQYSLVSVVNKVYSSLILKLPGI